MASVSFASLSGTLTAKSHNRFLTHISEYAAVHSLAKAAEASARTEAYSKSDGLILGRRATDTLIAHATPDSSQCLLTDVMKRRLVVERSDYFADRCSDFLIRILYPIDKLG